MKALTIPSLTVVILALALLPLTPTCVHAAKPVVSGETKEHKDAGKPSFAKATAGTSSERDARMTWWREARFGMFIHWGLYAVPAGIYDGKKAGGTGEWIMYRVKIPVALYAEYAKEFNPVKFNADEWVKIAKDAGMKYIVITAKHHDGFAMYPSKVSPFNIVDATPFKRDPLAELAAACRKEGIKLGFYYSQAQDWHHSGGAKWRTGAWDPAQNGSMDEYIDKIAVPQVREILSNYGEFPVVLWWDTPKEMTKERAEKLFQAVQELKPDIIMNNRLGGGYHKGDTETPEQKIPAEGFKDRDWETCMTLNSTWGYKSSDNDWKSTEKLLRNLIDIASKGGNYLLNVGPDAEGVIPQPSVQRLAEVGAWMKVNGESVYGTTASPSGAPAWGRYTKKGNKLYAHVFDWPKDGNLTVDIKDLKSPSVTLLATKANLEVKETAEGLSIKVPDVAPDKIASVIVIENQ